MPDADVRMGLRLEVTREERRLLEEIGARMHTAAHQPRVGWLREYVYAHIEAGKIIHAAVTRSHAS